MKTTVAKLLNHIAERKHGAQKRHSGERFEVTTPVSLYYTAIRELNTATRELNTKEKTIKAQDSMIAEMNRIIAIQDTCIKHQEKIIGAMKDKGKVARMKKASKEVVG